MSVDYFSVYDVVDESMDYLTVKIPPILNGAHITDPCVLSWLQAQMDGYGLLCIYIGGDYIIFKKPDKEPTQ